MSWFQDSKMWLVETTHLAKDALHIYVALAVFFGACLAFGWRAHQWRPLLAVVAAALLGEAWDIFDTWRTGQPQVFSGNAKDIVNTLAVPLLIVLAARYTPIFCRR